MIIHIIIATFQMPINVLKNLMFKRNSRLLSTKMIFNIYIYVMEIYRQNQVGIRKIFTPEVTPSGHRLVTPHPEIYYDF
jgi:hypothetical protein